MCKRAKEIRQQIKQDSSIDVWQDRPNTAVMVKVKYSGLYYQAYGFSKVCWPDWWNRERGILIAQGKAEAKIVRQILYNQRIKNSAAFIEAFVDKALQEEMINKAYEEVMADG